MSPSTNRPQVRYPANYRANFLYPAKSGSIEEAGYEFANGHSEAYRKTWWKLLNARIRKAALNRTNHAPTANREPLPLPISVANAQSGALAPGLPPFRVQLSRAKGWRKPPNCIVVARPSKWGNPLKVGDPGIRDRFAAVNAFRNIIASRADEVRRELRGRNLACWCPLGEPCHADVLLSLANDASKGGA